MLAAQAQEVVEGEPDGIITSVEKTKTTIVFFYADWCPSCKVVEPRIEDAIQSLDEDKKDDLTIVKFDFSNEFTQGESAGLAGQYGLSELYNEYAPGTGFAVLIDEDVELFEQVRLTQTDSTDEMKKKLKDFIKIKS